VRLIDVQIDEFLECISDAALPSLPRQVRGFSCAACLLLPWRLAFKNKRDECIVYLLVKDCFVEYFCVLLPLLFSIFYC